VRTNAACRIGLWIAGAIAVGCAAGPQAPSEALPDAGEPKIARLPGVTVNLSGRYLEMEGQVCLREGILELIATIPAGKEHESIVSLRTRPSSLHAALLMLGLNHGKPGQWRYYPDRVETVDPTGDHVRVTLLIEREGMWVEKPIHYFVVGRDGKSPLSGSEFVFAGSQVVQREPGSEPVYLADQSGRRPRQMPTNRCSGWRTPGRCRRSAHP
jgi:hypothetical protein